MISTKAGSWDFTLKYPSIHMTLLIDELHDRFDYWFIGLHLYGNSWLLANSMMEVSKCLYRSTS